MSTDDMNSGSICICTVHTEYQHYVRKILVQPPSPASDNLNPSLSWCPDHLLYIYTRPSFIASYTATTVRPTIRIRQQFAAMSGSHWCGRIVKDTVSWDFPTSVLYIRHPKNNFRKRRCFISLWRQLSQVCLHSVIKPGRGHRHCLIRLSDVIDTDEPKPSNVIDTAEPVKSLLSQFYNLFKGYIFCKKSF